MLVAVLVVTRVECAHIYICPRPVSEKVSNASIISCRWLGLFSFFIWRSGGGFSLSNNKMGHPKGCPIEFFFFICTPCKYPFHSHTEGVQMSIVPPATAAGVGARHARAASRRRATVPRRRVARPAAAAAAAAPAAAAVPATLAVRGGWRMIFFLTFF